MRLSPALRLASFAVAIHALSSHAMGGALDLDAHGHIVSSSTAVGGPWAGTNINTLVGANAFYSRGYTGTRTVVANIEGGTAWSGHETLQTATTRIYDPTQVGTHLGEFDRHATWTAQTIAGRGSAAYQQGMAPGATLWSGAIAASYNGTPFSLSYNFPTWYTLFYPYKTSMVDGINGRTADVVSSSWGSTYSQSEAISPGIDALVAQSHKTMVVSAGNAGYGTNTVGAPAAGQNVISVAALGPDTDGYSHASSFSSGGFSDYVGPDGNRSAARVRVDIAAPGESMTLAYYGGATGGNYGGTADGGSNYYSFFCAGTSFAAPTVAGGAALLVDAGKALYGTPRAIDGRVVKAVLLNSATETVGYNNGEYTDGNGVVRTEQALDPHVGAGRMNLDKAWMQYTSGTNDLTGSLGGAVQTVGWDFGAVASNSHNDYLLNALQGGSKLTATLNWFTETTINQLDPSAYYYGYHSFTNLNLELWTATNGVAGSLVAISDAAYITTQHLSLLVPQTGQYVLRVAWAGERYDLFNEANGATYGLAWYGTQAVPEPASLAALTLGGLLVLRRRRRR